MSRRELVGGAGIAVVGGALLATGVIRSGAFVTALAALRRSTFARHIGETFRVRLAPSGQLSLRLVAIRDLRQDETDHEQSFLLRFSGPPDQPLQQDTYTFEHAQIGAFALFIVPMASDRGVRGYEAIFNR